MGLVAIVVAVSTPACDDKTAGEKKEGEPQSVAEGAKAQTAVGKQVEKGKEAVEAAEAQLQARDDQIMKKSAGEKVERGQVP